MGQYVIREPEMSEQTIKQNFIHNKKWAAKKKNHRPFLLSKNFTYPPSYSRLGVGPSGVVIDTFPYFVSKVLHLISSAVLAFGSIYHALLVLGPKTLEESFPFFDYVWKDRNKITTILGIHLILLGIDVFLLVFKAIYFGGLYDTWATRGEM
ncbi:hypothetical protein ACJW31_06G106100 [Castanea mollissima]